MNDLTNNLLFTCIGNTPDIRGLWHSIAQVPREDVYATIEFEKKPAAVTTPSTAPTSVRDTFSSLSKQVARSDEMQMNLALRNSLKDTFMSDKERLNTRRRLFADSDKKIIKKFKRPAFEDEVVYLDMSPDSKPAPKKLPSKTQNRVSNNNLDARYVQATQTLNESPPRSLPSELLRAVRSECIRRMKLKDNAAQQQAAKKSVVLFRILTRKSPAEMWKDISTLATDCHSNGDTIEDTVECMLTLLADE